MNDTKQYVLTLTKDYVNGFVMGVITVLVVKGFVKRRKSEKEEA